MAKALFSIFLACAVPLVLIVAYRKAIGLDFLSTYDILQGISKLEFSNGWQNFQESYYLLNEQLNNLSNSLLSVDFSSIEGIGSFFTSLGGIINIVIQGFVALFNLLFDGLKDLYIILEFIFVSLFT